MSSIDKSFGKKNICTNFNLDIEVGDMVALIGESGCGKTTLLNIMGLIEPFDGGKLKILEEEGAKPNSSRASRIIRKNISYLFQNFALVSNETVADNIILALKYSKDSRFEKSKLISDVLKEVGLSGYENEPVFTLSGGEQQRVALARILVNPKPLILADEPTGSLDPVNRDIIMYHLRRLNKAGATVVIVTHDKYVAEECNKVINIRK